MEQAPADSGPCRPTRAHAQAFVIDDTTLHLSFQGCKKESFLHIFSYNAKPSFEIAKRMAKNMLWQNMKINKILQKT